MRIGLLDFSGILLHFGISKKPGGEKDILVDKIEQLGHEPKVYRAEECQIFFDGEKVQMFQMHEPLPIPDVLIPRVDLASRLDLELPLLKQFELMNIPIINGYTSIIAAKNKLRTIQLLTEQGIPVPHSIVVRKFEYLDEAVKAMGGYPVILKAPFGSYGCGVLIVESARSLYSSLDFIYENTSLNVFMIQEYIAEANGEDYRAFVIGDRVAASMRRRAKTGDFRSNLQLGGDSETVELSPEEKKMAVKAAKTLGLQIAGVDILRSKRGPLVMEVNSNAGFKGLSQTTQVDIAAEIVKFAVDFAQKY